jgi:hypothetical protein
MHESGSPSQPWFARLTVCVLCLIAAAIGAQVAAGANRASRSTDRVAGAARAHHRVKACPNARARARSHLRVLFGDRRVESHWRRAAGGVAAAFPFRSASSGRASSICVYVGWHSRAKTLVAGLYLSDHGHPGALVTSGSLRSPRRGAWNLVRITGGVTAGRRYWLGLLGARGRLDLRQRRAGSCHGELSISHRLRSLPSAWAHGAHWGRCPVSAYVNGTSVAAGKPSPPGSPGGPPSDPGAPPSRPPGGKPTLPACTESFGPSANLNSVLRAAPAGAVVCLGSGTYSTGMNLSGINPARTVTVRPGDGATVIFAGGGLSLSGTTQHLAFIGFIAPSNFQGGLAISGSGVAHVAFAYDNFDGTAAHGQGQVGLSNLAARSDVTLAGDTFINVSPCTSCAEGTISVFNSGADNDPDGVTIANNLIRGGLADGIQWGGKESGTRVLNNEITGKIQASSAQCSAYGSSCPHTDGLQFVGDSRDIVLSGNYMHNDTDDILQADGSNRGIIATNNVFAVADTSIRAVQVAGWQGGTFSHNTLNSYSTWDCTHDGACTSGVSMTNNVLMGGFGDGVQTGGGQFSTEAYNLTASCPHGCGSHDIVGRPTFQGGAKPGTYLGWRLATGSLGVGNASDGANRGVGAFSVTLGP